MYPQTRTHTRSHSHVQRWPLLVSVLALLALLAATALVPTAGASTSSDELTVTARNAGAVSLTVLRSDPINFGTNLTASAEGWAPNGDPDVYPTTAGTQGSQGRYYIWRQTESLVQVQSNVPWDGKISAVENCTDCSSHSTSMTIASGVLRLGVNADDTGNHPVTYTAAAGLPAIPNSTSGSGYTWLTNGPTGTTDYWHLFALRVDHDDAPGDFGATITYTATT